MGHTVRVKEKGLGTSSFLSLLSSSGLPAQWSKLFILQYKTLKFIMVGLLLVIPRPLAAGSFIGASLELFKMDKPARKEILGDAPIGRLLWESL